MQMSDILHEGKTIPERIDTGVAAPIKLNALLSDEQVEVTTPTRPTADLIKLKKGSDLVFPNVKEGGFFVYCSDTEETWYAETQEILDANFVYREDLWIIPIDDVDDAKGIVLNCNAELDPGMVTRKSCYIMDNPSIEKYEVFYDPAYPANRYGKCSPSGAVVVKYRDRFARDEAILALDKKYSEASATQAKKLAESKLQSDEAIVISDGTYSKQTCAYSCVYMDDRVIGKYAESKQPSKRAQGNLIAEICGAMLALRTCYRNRKYNITYYYDNTSIANVLASDKNSDIAEVRSYRKLCMDMDAAGYKINFVEIHPKQAEHVTDTKALLYLHNLCDRQCTEMTSLFARKYADFASTGNKEGKTYRALSKNRSNRERR